MTAPARITQADMDRATKAVANAKIERARIVMDLANQRIEIIVGEPANTQGDTGAWTDEDV
jgi:hypothetical protein